MIADKVFYADAVNHVIVTESIFIVKNKEYDIPAIREHQMKEVKPAPIPGLVFALMGATLVLLGMFQIVAFEFIPEVTLFDLTIDAHWWAIIAGGLLLVGGALQVLLVKPRYALHISTAKEEDDVIITPKKESVKMIVDALNRAFMLMKK